MASQQLTDIALDTARQEYLDALRANGMSPQKESLAVASAAGRITAAPVYARICVPPYNTCAMNGIAIDAKISSGASATIPVQLDPGQYWRVSTGDLLPQGCNTVLRSEDLLESETRFIEGSPESETHSKEGRPEGETHFKLDRAVAPWQHIRQIGEDVYAGEMLLPSFSFIRPVALGTMLASGVSSIEVIKRPTVGIIPIDDYQDHGAVEASTESRAEHNSVVFTAMLCEWGAETLIFPTVRSDKALIREAIETALIDCDVVILGMGLSAHAKDCLTDAISDVGKVLYYGLAIRPGKSAILGHSGAKPIIGLPGNPVSGIIVIEELLRPIVELLCGKVQASYDYAEAVLLKAIVSDTRYEEFVRVRMGYIEGRLIASPLSRGSGVATSFMKADGIIQVPQDVAGYRSGAQVQVRLLRKACDLEHNIVVTGSHDPLFDELAEILRIMFGDVSVVSSHVGSMGGIMAVRHGEAHAAGIHLLDEITGEYNSSFVRKHFPKGGARLVECVSRTQGLLLAKGNPKGIMSFADLEKEGLRYVNRQKGSGTRVLIDYLCRKHGIETSGIDGYDREEYTHTSVAALIAEDSADTGLGIYSIAKMYDLDFLPICNEQFDVLISDNAWSLPMIQRFLEALESDAFRQRLDTLGGYSINKPGAVRTIQ